MREPETDSPTFGEVLRERRERAGLTREELARLSRLSTATIKFLETGRRRTMARTTAYSLLAVAPLGLTVPDLQGVRIGRKQPCAGQSVVRLDVDLGEVLRSVRIAGGLSRREAGAKCGESETAITRLERTPSCKLEPRQARLLKSLLFLLGVHLDLPASGLRGLQLASAQKRQEIARQGGTAAQTSGNAHKFTPAEASAAGKLGGAAVSKDPQHMATIGRAGGLKRQAIARSEVEKEVLDQLKGGAVLIRLRSDDAEFFYVSTKEHPTGEGTRRRLRSIAGLYRRKELRNGPPVESWVPAEYLQILLTPRGNRGR